MHSKILTRNNVAYGSLLTLGYFLICVLPWHIPLAHRVVSDSYNLGFNNRIAVIGLGFTLLCFTIWRWVGKRSVSSVEPSPDAIIDGGEIGHFKKADFAVASFFSICGCLFVFSLWKLIPFHYFSESIWFIPGSERILLGQIPYRDFQFNYGPLFLYLPVWLVKLSGGAIDAGVAYLYSLMVVTVAGMWALGLMHSILPAHRRMACYFPIAIVCSMNFSLGMNYTLVRFVLPYAALVLLFKAASALEKQSLTFARLAAMALAFPGGVMFCFATSPETGVLATIGSVVFLVSLGRRQTRAEQVIFAVWIAAALLASLFFLFCLPQNYFLSISSFSGGGYNFPVYLSLFTLAYLISLVIVVPVLGTLGIKNHGPLASLCLAWCAMVVLSAAPSLGRCDLGHLFFNGLGAYVALFAISPAMSARFYFFYRWIFACMIVIFLGLVPIMRHEAMINGFLHDITGRETKCDRKFWKPPVAQDVSLTSRLDRIFKGRPKVGIPLGCDERWEIYLKRTGRYIPDYMGSPFQNPLTLQDVEIKKKEMAAMNFIVVPVWIKDMKFGAQAKESYARSQSALMSDALLIPIDYRWVNEPLFPYREWAAYILNNFEVERQVDDYFLMARKRK